jgi:N-acetylglucosamine kinase-like BadF-type ATPase
MNKNPFFIGLDSGGTKSELLITDANNSLVHEVIHKAIHYSTHGKEKVSGYLSDIILSSIKEKKLRLKDCGGICIGLAGVREAEDKKELQKSFIKLLGYKNILIESDSIIALKGAFRGKDGLILICGTGSILIGLINKKSFRIGGWGRIIGDYGSGYEIGKHAFKHLVSEYDKRKKLSKLSQAIENEFSLNKINILKHVYQNNFHLQSLVPLVLEYANKGNKDAQEIIDKAIDELLNHFRIFFSVSGHKRKIRVALSGSILENENILSIKLKKRIKRNFSNIDLVNRLQTPAEGAIFLAKNKFYNN